MKKSFLELKEILKEARKEKRLAQQEYKNTPEFVKFNEGSTFMYDEAPKGYEENKLRKIQAFQTIEHTKVVMRLRVSRVRKTGEEWL